MGWRERAGRAVAELRVRMMDGIVSAIAQRPVRTVATGNAAASHEGGRKSLVSPSPPPAPVAEVKVEAQPAVVVPPPPRAPVAEAKVEARPSEVEPDRVVVVARDPDTAFVHWRLADDRRELALIWRAGDRTIRVEEIAEARGKQFLPFVDPNLAHTASIAVRGQVDTFLLTSNAVLPPASAPRVEGPPHYVRAGDDNIRAIADAQERARAELPRPYAAWGKSGPTSR